jgi:hypothetical protein
VILAMITATTLKKPASLNAAYPPAQVFHEQVSPVRGLYQMSQNLAAPSTIKAITALAPVAPVNPNHR